jgi:imidazolonepropionase-like amidohydrolase
VYISDADLKTMAQKGVYYIPTIFVAEYVAQGRANEGAKVWLDMIKVHADTFSRALKAGVKIVFGTDVGGFDWAIDPAKEFPLMVKYGMTPMQAIRAATATAAELLDKQNEIGSIAPGKFADIVAVKGDPLKDISLLGKIDFVMKGGETYKTPGH